MKTLNLRKIYLDIYILNLFVTARQDIETDNL